MERLQRILAARGIASRRAAEELITSGRVSVDGKVVTELGTRADPIRSTIRVDGKLLKSQRPRYIVLNKPRGYITTTKDERDRRTVMDLVQVPERIYPVGRLDRDTEGLLLLTNDGDVANRVMHPRYGLEKEYHVLTLTRPPDAVLQRLRSGVIIEGRRVVPEEVRIQRETVDGLILKVVVHEGMHHLVRRMMDEVGIPVERLRRVRLGPLSVSGIQPGVWRELSHGELTTLLEALHLDRANDSGVDARVARYQPARQGPPLRNERARTRNTRNRYHDDALRELDDEPAAGARHDRREPPGRPERQGGRRQEYDGTGESTWTARPGQRHDRPLQRERSRDNRTPGRFERDRHGGNGGTRNDRSPRRYDRGDGARDDGGTRPSREVRDDRPRRSEERGSDQSRRWDRDRPVNDYGNPRRAPRRPARGERAGDSDRGSTPSRPPARPRGPRRDDRQEHGRVTRWQNRDRDDARRDERRNDERDGSFEGDRDRRPGGIREVERGPRPRRSRRRDLP